MKYLVMTEGTCEKALIDVLIKKGLFSLSIESLLYEQIFHARQIKNSIIERINQLPVSEKICIIRIGDTLTDELDIPNDIRDRVESCRKICIKPEFEIFRTLYPIGAIINHPIYGKGTVKSHIVRETGLTLEIRFDSGEYGHISSAWLQKNALS